MYYFIQRNHRHDSNSYGASWTLLLSYGTVVKLYEQELLALFLKLARLYLANPRGHSEEQAAEVRMLRHSLP
jgi:hypothetical protein